jgi:hypothetical protein
LTWAQKESDVGENDHIIRIKDADKMPPAIEDAHLDGHSKIPSREISINADILENRLETGRLKKFSNETGLNGKFQATLERTIAHEAGHSGGLYHPKDQKKQSGVFNISENEYNAYYEGRNLMFQSIIKTRDRAGFFLIPKQIEILYEINKKQ